jgi:hypothetical protein
MLRQSESAAQTICGRLTLSERAIERQGWGSDIVEVGLEIGLYSVLS